MMPLVPLLLGIAPTVASWILGDKTGGAVEKVTRACRQLSQMVAAGTGCHARARNWTERQWVGRHWVGRQRAEQRQARPRPAWPSAPSKAPRQETRERQKLRSSS